MADLSNLRAAVQRRRNFEQVDDNTPAARRRRRFLTTSPVSPASVIIATSGYRRRIAGHAHLAPPSPRRRALATSVRPWPSYRRSLPAGTGLDGPCGVNSAVVSYDVAEQLFGRQPGRSPDSLRPQFGQTLRPQFGR